jgi:hypothetical protein
MVDRNLTSPPSAPPPVHPVAATRSGLIDRFLSDYYGRHVFLIAGLLLLIIGLNFYSKWFAQREAISWLREYNGTAAASENPVTKDTDSNSKPAGTPNTNRALPAGNASSNGSGTTQTSNAGTGTSNSTPANSNANVAGTASQPAATPIPSPTPVVTLTAEQEKRRMEQLQTVKNLINHHSAVMAFFYENYYISIYLVLFAGVISALTLFFIAKNGWGNTNQYVKTVFVVMTATTAYYGLFPPVFEIEKNIADNKALFLEYKALENEVTSYPLTGANIKHEAKKPEEFISYVDSELARLGNIAIGFDYTKINYKGAFDLNKSTNNANANETPVNTPSPVKKP